MRARHVRAGTRIRPTWDRGPGGARALSAAGRARRPEGRNPAQAAWGRILQHRVARGRRQLIGDVGADTAGRLRALETFAARGDMAAAGGILDDWLAGPDGGQMLAVLEGHPVLAEVCPELAATRGFEQDTPWHPEGDLYLHTRQVTERLCALGADADLRWAGVLHDLGKPASKWFGPEGNAHYYANPELGKEAHERIGARMVEAIGPRLGLAPERVARIRHLVRHHMFAAFGSARGARKFRERVGEAYVEPLLVFRQADWEADGDPAAFCARLREYLAAADAPAPDRQTRLALSGGDLATAFGLEGPAVGALVRALQEAVREGRVANEPEALMRLGRTLQGS